MPGHINDGLGAGGSGPRVCLDEDATDALREKQQIVEEHRDVARRRDPWAFREEGMRCHSCTFYVPKAIANSPGHSPLGRCRRNAPTMRGFPAVFPHDWCGEHRLDERRVT